LPPKFAALELDVQLDHYPMVKNVILHSD